MSYYAGLDVSQETTFITIVDSTGKVVYKKNVITDPSEIYKNISSFGAWQKIEKIGIETGQLSTFLSKQLRAKQLPIICICSRKMAALLELNTNKNDENDSKAIAEAMRVDSYKEVYVKSDESCERGAMLTLYKKTCSHRTAMVNCLRGVFKQFGISKLGAQNNPQFIETLFKKNKLLPETLQPIVAGQIQAIQALSHHIEEIKQKISELSAQNPQCHLLKTVDGVGDITAFAFVQYIDDIDRFDASRDIGAYLGLTPRLRESGEVSRTGRISKRGNKMLRSLLYESAVVLLTRTKQWSLLKAWGRKIMKKKGLKKAAVAVARKMAMIMLAMLRNQIPFQRGREHPQEQTQPKSQAKQVCIA